MKQVLVSEELLRQALGALEQQNVIGFSGTISALRTALEQPVVGHEEDGWRLRNVYFEGGEPMMHTAPQAQQPAVEPVCDKDPQGCWNVRCQLGKKCKNTAPQAQQPIGWLRAIDEEMVSTHLGVADITDSYENAKRKLNTLICWHVDVSHDPKVNGSAQQPQRSAVRCAGKAVTFEQVANQQKHLLRQDAELERLRKDAARYQWLRDHCARMTVARLSFVECPQSWYSDHDVESNDAAIDEAMEAKT